jgi:hypothetical protein
LINFTLLPTFKKADKMTVILVGKAPKGNLIVTDAMAAGNDRVRSYKECRLIDKIAWLRCAQFYCSLVGDANILDGIEYLDVWYLNKNLRLDFSKIEMMHNALTATEKCRELRRRQGYELLLNDYSNIYFINKEQVFEYEIILKRNKYIVENFKVFPTNKVVILYGNILEYIPNFAFPNDQLFDKAKDYIELVHKNCKKKAKIDNNFECLDYDFDNRFCGVVFSKKKNEMERFYSPYNKLSEAIAANADNPKTTWKLIEDKKFSWSPQDIAKPRK